MGRESKSYLWLQFKRCKLQHRWGYSLVAVVRVSPQATGKETKAVAKTQYAKKKRNITEET